jgi:Ca-activated chloride channel homolog
MSTCASGTVCRFTPVLALFALFWLAFIPLTFAQSAPQLPPRSTPPPYTPPAPQQSTQAPAQDQQQGGDQPTAQQPIAPAEDQSGMFVFKKQVEEVVLHATVVDAEQHLVTGLSRNDFSISEHGVPQSITSFRREDIPVEMGIVIDNSGSMRDKRDKVSQAVMDLIRASNPQDEIFVVNFGTESYLDQDFTSDAHLLEAALHQVSARGSTALYDAIVASAIHLKNDTRLEKKVLLVITDGQDNMSQQTLQEAQRRLQQANGPTMYAIGLLGVQGRGRDALQAIAQGTGGVAYFPDTLDQVNNIARTIAHDIRSQYIIAYKPTKQNGKPGYASVQVQARAPGYSQLTVRTRTGYYPPEGSH